MTIIDKKPPATTAGLKVAGEALASSVTPSGASSLVVAEIVIPEGLGSREQLLFLMAPLAPEQKAGLGTDSPAYLRLLEKSEGRSQGPLVAAFVCVP